MSALSTDCRRRRRISGAKTRLPESLLPYFSVRIISPAKARCLQHMAARSSFSEVAGSRKSPREWVHHARSGSKENDGDNPAADAGRNTDLSERRRTPSPLKPRRSDSLTGVQTAYVPALTRSFSQAVPPRLPFVRAGPVRKDGAFCLTRISPIAQIFGRVTPCCP